MRVLSRVSAVLALSLVSLAQSYPPAGPPNPRGSGDLGIIVTKIEQETQGLNSDVGKLRIEKWKTDSSSKAQATENAASIQRNITAALPDLIAAVRANPQSLAANFKLYRNLNALYDVVSNVAESAGAFGKREEYDLIGPHVSALDDSRRSYADYLQQMATNVDGRLAAAARQAQTAATQSPPKKIIVDDDEPTPPPKKKRTKKGTASNSSASTSTPK